MVERMKDSGNQWIGEIPENWNTNKIKYLATLKGRIGWQGLTSDEYQDEGACLITGTDFDNGKINWETCVHVPMKRWEEAKEIQIENGDLLITKDGTVGKVAIVSDMPEETSLNSGVLRIMTNEGYNRRFLFWVLQSDVFWNWFNYKNAGNSTIVHLYQGDFAEFMYAFPNEKEQQSIADFLDKRCAQIDDVIADLEKQIDFLSNSRKQLITECITSGLDISVDKKDSGVQWIGSVPMHWQVKDIKYFSDLITKGATPEEVSAELTEQYPIRFLKAENIQNNLLNETPEHYISLSDASILRRCELQPKDLLLVIAGATIGKVAITGEETIPARLNQAVCVIRLNKMMNQKYYYYALQSQIVAEAISLLVVQAAQPNLSMGNIGNIKLPVPPKHEQDRIAQYLDNKCNRIDEILLQKNEQLKMMTEMKKSLIYEYVTGKKRVKEVDAYAN